MQGGATIPATALARRMSLTGQEGTSPLRRPLAAMFDKPDIEWPSTVAQQLLGAGAIIYCDAPRGIQREAAVLPGEHLADIVRRDQPAEGEPAQHPHAHLLGNDGEGLRCQLSGGAKAHGLRDITGILDRL
jgi:hypothetical protein